MFEGGGDGVALAYVAAGDTDGGAVGRNLFEDYGTGSNAGKVSDLDVA